MSTNSTSVATQLKETAHFDELAATDTLGIKEVAAMLGLSQVYVRHAVRNGNLKTTKVPISEDSKTMKHVILVSEIERWRNATGGHSRREDGRSRFLLYATAEELEKVKVLLAKANNGAIIEKQVYVKHQPADVEETS